MGAIGKIFGLVVLIVFASTQITNVANFTTGITIAHTGFTPNPNVTGTAGLVPLIQLIPFIFVAGILFAALNQSDIGGILAFNLAKNIISKTGRAMSQMWLRFMWLQALGYT